MSFWMEWRIQERAQVLQDERKKAEAKRIVLLDLCQKRDVEKTTNEKQRKRLLQATNERNSVELEIMGVRESIEDCWKRAKTMEEETRESEERIRKLEENRAESTESFYGPNLAKMETFLKVLETIVDSKEKVVEARRKRIEDLRTRLEDSKEKEETILRETQETKLAINREEGVHNDETDEESTESESGKKRISVIAQKDNEIDNLSSRVRETIEMVSKSLKSHNLLELRLLIYSCRYDLIHRPFFVHLYSFQLRTRDLLSAESLEPFKRSTTRPTKTCSFGRRSTLKN